MHSNLLMITYFWKPIFCIHLDHRSVRVFHYHTRSCIIKPIELSFISLLLWSFLWLLNMMISLIRFAFNPLKNIILHLWILRTKTEQKICWTGPLGSGETLFWKFHIISSEMIPLYITYWNNLLACCVSGFFPPTSGPFS